MHRKQTYIPIILLIIASFVSTARLASQDSDYGIISQKTYWWFNNSGPKQLKENAKPVVQIPPICGKKKRKLGNDIALPFGIGANFLYYKQAYHADDLKLVSDSTGITAVGEANVQNSTSSQMKLTVRPDIWLLPFLNVYGIFGYSRSVTSPNVEIPSVTIGGILVIDTVVSISDELVYFGPTYGGGATISSGFKRIVFILDYHYAVTKPKDLENKLESHTFSAKVGVLLGKNQNKVKGSLWAGTSYMNDNHQFTGEVDVKDILPGYEIIFGEKATYSGSVTAKQPWNFVIGGSMLINKHHIFAVELGYFKREQVSVNYSFRF